MFIAVEASAQKKETSTSASCCCKLRTWLSEGETWFTRRDGPEGLSKFTCWAWRWWWWWWWWSSWLLLLSLLLSLLVTFGLSVWISLCFIMFLNYCITIARTIVAIKSLLLSFLETCVSLFHYWFHVLWLCKMSYIYIYIRVYTS